MDFLDGIIGQIEVATGTATKTPWWACEEGCPPVQVEDPGGAICQVCNKGRLFKGSTQKLAEMFANSSRLIRLSEEAKAVMVDETVEEPTQAEMEVTGVVVTPQAANPVFAAAEEVKAKIASEKAALYARLDELNVPYSTRLGIKKLQELVAAAVSAAETARGKTAPSPIGNPGTAAGIPIGMGKAEPEATEQVQGCDNINSAVTPGESGRTTGDESSAVVGNTEPEPEIADEPTTEDEPVIEEDETPQETVSSEKVDFKAVRLAATAALIRKFGLSEISPVLMGTAVVQTHGFTVWADKDGNRVPSFRLQQPFESNTDFGKVYDSFKAGNPSLSVDVVQCNNVSNQELKACLYSGNLLAGLNNGNGTQMAKVGETVKIGVLKTQKGHLRFVVLEIMR